jgi:hypothetical protein
MIFYCPHCKTLEIGKTTSYTNKDTIANNCRDGYGLGLHYVVCKNCSYPLSAIVFESREDEDIVWYFKTIIEDYQNGNFAKKDDMLNWIKKIYEYRNQEIVDICDKFLNDNKIDD